MRFFIASVFGLAAIVSAQSVASSISSVSSVLSSTVSHSSSSVAPMSTSPVTACLAACAYGDVCCQAKCVNVPCPSALQANATTDCAMQCPQGNGSQSETEQYADCQAKCVSSYFFTSGTAGAAAATHASGAAASGATTTGSGSSTRTGSGASSTASATQNAAPEVRFGAAGVGLVGLFIAGLAM